MFCISCGKSLPDNFLFCPFCGAKLTREGKPEEPHLRPLQCTSCGGTNLKKIRTGEYRCEHCGMVFSVDGQKMKRDDQTKDAEMWCPAGHRCVF